MLHALRLLPKLLTKHAKDALGLGIPPEEHVRSIFGVPG